MVELVVMVSDGTKLPAIWQYTQKPNSRSRLALIISNKENSKCFDFAKQHNIPTFPIIWEKEKGESRQQFSNKVGKFIASRVGNYLIISAGWPYVLTKEFIQQFLPNKIINLHPGLLPDNPNDNEIVLGNGEKIPALKNVYSMKAFEETLKRGLKWTGVTVHFLTEEVDSGPVILRQEVPVLKSDTIHTLADRVHNVEDEILPRAIDILIKKEEK